MIHFLFSDIYGDYFWDAKYAEVFYVDIFGIEYFIDVAFTYEHAYDIAEYNWELYNKKEE